MPELLTLIQIGNQVLREQCHSLSDEEIFGDTVQALIANMRYTLTEEAFGVAIAAPQVGENVALSVVGIKPTPNRPGLEPFDAVLINPQISRMHGEPELMWEGCVSCGRGDDTLFAQVPRYREITLRWKDENAKLQRKRIGGFVAHVAQHEVDHLNGILFVDRVIDSKSYMSASEYRRRIIKR